MPTFGIDAWSKVTEAAREVINGNFQATNFLGGISPTIEAKEEYLRRQSASRVRGYGQGNTNTPKLKNGDVGEEGIQSNPQEVNSPGQSTDHRIIIKDTITLEEVKLPYIPLELDYNPDSKFVDIASMGRNNPLYHYTGSEDILKFTIDWYTAEDSRQDVLLHCKFIESLSKNDGFGNPPHPVILVWGDIMFSDSKWLVTSAPYKLSQFHADRNMMPQQAYQTITLKKITATNLLRDDITKMTT